MIWKKKHQRDFYLDQDKYKNNSFKCKMKKLIGNTFSLMKFVGFKNRIHICNNQIAMNSHDHYDILFNFMSMKQTRQKWIII